MIEQVGGDHYKSTYEVWDFVSEFNLDFFQGNIIKYVTRFRKKNGIEDLKKALSYAEKAYEVFNGDDVEFDAEDVLEFNLFITANGIGSLDYEAKIILLTITNDYYEVSELIKELIGVCEND